MTTSDAPPPYDGVVFDCDSTLSAMEGVEELGRRRPDVLAELKTLTDAAMDGSVPLEQVFGRRLELVRPSRADVGDVAALYVGAALPHAREVVAALRALGKRVTIVSGGLRPAVLGLATHLGLGPDDVHAVDVRFDEDGAYAGFDEDSPLARAGGKIEVLASLAADGPLAFVGDGATDFEAAHLARRFVGFGGVVAREGVLAACTVTCRERDLAALLPLLLSPAELERLANDPEHAELLRALPPLL
jgi:phosphoserine phosphatase